MRYASPAAFALAAALLPAPAAALDLILDIAPFADGSYLVLRDSATEGRFDVAVLANDQRANRYRLAARHEALLPLVAARTPYITRSGERHLGFRTGFDPATGLDGFLEVTVLPALGPGDEGELQIVAITLQLQSTEDRDRYGACTIDYFEGKWDVIFRAGSATERESRSGTFFPDPLESLERLRAEPWRAICADLPLPD